MNIVKGTDYFFMILNKVFTNTLACLILLMFAVNAFAITNSANVVKGEVSGVQNKIRVLFVGNSYTYWIEDVMNFVLKKSDYKSSTFDYHTRGATALSYFVDDQGLSEKIAQGNYDYVVLQEWSRGVGSNNPDNQKSFSQSVSILSKSIRLAGAEPLLYMTWGRDAAKGYDGFSDMSARVSKGYTKVGKDNNVKVIPVGKVWEEVRRMNKSFGLALYEDGTHPSIKGQVLITATFMRALFSDDLEWGEAFSSHLSKKEWNVIKDAVKNQVKLGLTE